MKKIKILIISSICIISMFLINNTVSAESILVTKSVTAGKGIITYVISGLTLDTTKTYYYMLQTEEGSSITAGERKHTIGTLDANSVTIELNPSNIEMYAFLTTKDKAKITIKKQEDDSIVLDSHLIDLSLPVTQAMAFKTVDSSIMISSPYRDYTQINHQFVKITDQSLVNDYLQLREQGKDISEIKDRLTKDIPQTGWINGDNPSLPTQEGLYYIWGQALANGKKTIAGYILYDNLPKTDNPDENNTNTNTNTSTNTNTNTENNTISNENVANNTINNENNVINNGIITNNKVDNTVSNNKIPNAGTDFIVCGVIALIIVIGVAGIVKYQKYKQIK